MFEKKPTIRRVKEIFGSWFKALNKADVLDDGAIRGKLHVSQLGDGRRLSTDEFGLYLIDEKSANTDQDKVVLSLGQKFPCRLRGLDLWSGELDLAPI